MVVHHRSAVVLMAEWTVEDAEKWILLRCLDDEAAHPRGVGIAITLHTLTDKDPPRDLVEQAMLRLKKRRRVFARVDTSFATHPRPFEFSKVTLSRDGYEDALLAKIGK